MFALDSLDVFLVVATILLALTSLAFFAAAIWAMRKKTLLSLPTLGSLVLALLFVSLAALFGTLALATQGYRALTREDVAAVVRTEPMGAERFKAHFVFANGEQASYELAGNELYVDAYILKWKPVANFIGLHTSYELDRVAGRYTSVRDEQTKVRTVYSLAKNKPFDIFQLRKSYSIFNPLLDVEYGSATFKSAPSPAAFEIRVSTTGLLLREAKVNAKVK